MNRAKPENRLARVLQAEALRNGHALPGVLADGMAAQLSAPQVVRFNPLPSAVAIVDSVLPGNPMPIFVEQGKPPIMGQMIDWTAVSDEMRARLPAEPTAEQFHNVNLVNAVAAFQRSAQALAEAAKALREKPVSLPEPPSEDRAPEGLNGSPNE